MDLAIRSMHRCELDTVLVLDLAPHLLIHGIHVVRTRGEKVFPARSGTGLFQDLGCELLAAEAQDKYGGAVCVGRGDGAIEGVFRAGRIATVGEEDHGPSSRPVPKQHGGKGDHVVQRRIAPGAQRVDGANDGVLVGRKVVHKLDFVVELDQTDAVSISEALHKGGSGSPGLVQRLAHHAATDVDDQNQRHGIICSVHRADAEVGHVDIVLPGFELPFRYVQDRFPCLVQHAGIGNDLRKLVQEDLVYDHSRS